MKVEVPDGLVEQIDPISEHYGMTRSGVVEYFCRYGIARVRQFIAQEEARAAYREAHPFVPHPRANQIIDDFIWFIDHPEVKIPRFDYEVLEALEELEF